MNKLLTSLIFACLSSLLLTASAQQQPAQADKGPATLNPQSSKYFAGKETTTMTERLKLNKKQEEEIRNLNDGYYQQVAVLLQDKQEDPAIRRSKFDQLRAGHYTNLQQLLNKEQYATYTSEMAQVKARGDERIKKVNEALKAKQEMMRQGKPDSTTSVKTKTD